jgi:hypothetical protein
MTGNSVANPQSSPQAAKPSAVELSWDDALDGKFPPTRQQRLQQAALQAAEQLQEQANLPVTHDRLTKALDLMLSNAVVIYQDNTASVCSGSRSYTVANGCRWQAGSSSGAPQRSFFGPVGGTRGTDQCVLHIPGSYHGVDVYLPGCG